MAAITMKEEAELDGRLDKVIDLQRRLNEFDNLMFRRHMQQSSILSEHERRLFIQYEQQNYAEFVDCLIKELQ